MRRTVLLTSFATLLVGLALTACSSDTTSTASSATAYGPADVAADFLEAAHAGDRATLEALLTPAARAALAEDGSFSLDGAKLEHFELGAASVTGDEAQVAVLVVEDGREQPSTLLLRRADDAWRVYGMSVAIGDGSFTLDFEGGTDLLAEMGAQLVEGFAEEFGRQMEQAFADAQAAWAQGGTDEEIAAHHAAYAALRPVTESEHEAAWRVRVDAAGRSANAVLDELFRDTGVAFTTDGAPAFERALDLRLEGVSRVEAVERVAAAVGTHPVWPDDPAGGWGEEPTLEPVRFAAGPRPLPATLAGPFLVEVQALEEDAPNTVGTLTLAARALGLSPDVLAFQGDSEEYARVEALGTADGTPLTDLDVFHMSAPSVHGTYFVYAFDRPLEGLLRGVEAIDRVAGELRLCLPTTVEELTFEPGSAPRACALGTASVASWGDQVELSIEGERGAFEDVEVRMAPTNAAGEPMGVRFSSAMGWGTTLSASVQCPEAPAALATKVCRVTRVRVPFELGPVPLARFTEQPERLAELAFDGAAPVAVEVLSSKPRDDGDRDLELRVVNRSNKDAVSVQLRFEYLDARGEQLEDFPSTLTGAFDFDSGAVGPVAAAGETTEHEAWAPFVPEGTAKVRVRLTAVEFPDATTWEAEER